MRTGISSKQVMSLHIFLCNRTGWIYRARITLSGLLRSYSKMLSTLKYLWTGSTCCATKNPLSREEREIFWTIEMIVDLSEDAKTEFLTIFVRNGPYNLFLSLPLKLLQPFWQNLHSRVLPRDMQERKGICIISSVACTMLEQVLRYNVDG